MWAIIPEVATVARADSYYRHVALTHQAVYPTSNIQYQIRSLLLIQDQLSQLSSLTSFLNPSVRRSPANYMKYFFLYTLSLSLKHCLILHIYSV